MYAKSVRSLLCLLALACAACGSGSNAASTPTPTVPASTSATPTATPNAQPSSNEGLSKPPYRIKLSVVRERERVFISYELRGRQVLPGKITIHAQHASCDLPKAGWLNQGIDFYPDPDPQVLRESFDGLSGLIDGNLSVQYSSKSKRYRIAQTLERQPFWQGRYKIRVWATLIGDEFATVRTPKRVYGSCN
jgi:hypothetical protein